MLYLTADDFNYAQPGMAGLDEQIGYGLVDAEKAVAMVSGQNRIEQGATVSVADVAQQNDIWRSILSWPGIPAENYPCIRHTIRATVTFANAFISPPVVWARRLSSYGAGNENPIYDAVNVPTTDPGYGNPALVPWRPNAWSVSANSAQATFETYVYDLRDVTTATHRYWWPTAPAGVSFAYTAIGPVSLLGVPHGTSVVDEVRLSARPNPAGHGLTTLTLSVPKRDAVSLELLDVSGRLVRTIFSGTLSSGIHRYAWDLRGDDGQPVPAGLYFARCSTSRRGAAVSRVAVVR